MVPLHASIHSYLDQILDLLDEGICITDVTGVILYLNKRYEEISSIPREIMLGKKAQDFVHQGMLNIVVNPEVIQTHEIVTRVQNTSTGRFLLLEGHPVFDESGRPVMCLTFVRDESCMINQQATLMRQKEIIETFSRMEFEHVQKDFAHCLVGSTGARSRRNRHGKGRHCPTHTSSEPAEEGTVHQGGLRLYRPFAH